MKIQQLTHVALHVADVELSNDFYQRVLHLEKLPRPAFDFPGTWFRVGGDQELHLIGGRTEPVISKHRGTHFAMLVDDIEAWERHLIATQAKILVKKIRPDGAIQIFISDPDGHCVEICTPPGTAEFKGDSTY